MKPASLTTFTDAAFTPGATPAMPTPLIAPAIVAATCVPWLDVVGFQAASAVFTTPPRQDALLSLAIWVTRSGCVLEMPLSRTPTTTSGLPVVTAFAAGVLI